MSGHVYWMLETSVKDGKAEDLKSLMAEMIEATRNDEPGALDYEWSLSADEKTLHIFERYADAAATMVHLKNFGANFAGRFMQCLAPTGFKLYGNHDQAVRDAVAPMGAVVMNPVGGFSR